MRIPTVIVISIMTVLGIPAQADAAPPPIAGEQGHWVDLTHDFSADTIYWPNAEGFKLEKVYDGENSHGFHYAANRFAAAEHGGTHMDAPIHFDRHGLTVEKILPNQTTGEAVVIDVREACQKNRDYLIGADDFIRFEKKHGTIPEGAIVLMLTGFSQFWPDAERYLGTAEKGEAAIAKLHFPGLSAEGARWLVEHRHPRAVGLDTASIDYGQSTLFESHRILAEHATAVFENLDHLDQLPAKGSYLVALPMKIAGGSGAPLRAIAWVGSLSTN